MSLENYPTFVLKFSDTEMNGEGKHSYRFKSYLLKPEERQLLREEAPVPLTPKAFDVLTLLVTNAGHLVGKEELMQTVWADSFVEEANLARIVHTLRKILEQDDNGDKFIETVAKKGYRFVAEVKEESLPLARVKQNGNGTSIKEVAWPDEPVNQIDSPDTETDPKPNTHQNISKVRIVAGLAVLLAASFAAVLVWNRGTGNTPVAAQPVSIAILPFRPVSAANRDETFDLNFAYSMILRLDQVKSLKVRSFRAIKDYTVAESDPAVVGKEQKADYVLVSSYMVAGGKLRVTSDLYNVKTGFVDATLNHDGPDSELFAAGDIVASIFSKKLLAALNVEPVEPMANRGTESEAAWKHYVHGMNLTNKRIREDSDMAIIEFENAVRIDPDFAEAYVGLAYAHQSSFVNGGTKADHCGPGMDGADRAIELAPNLGEAYSIKAMNAGTCELNPSEAKELHRKALDLAPNSAFVRRFYGISLTNQGKGDESVAELKAAIDLDPNLPWTQKLLGRALYFARRYDEAIEQLKKTRELDKNDSTQTAYLFRSYALQGDFERAFEWFLVTEVIKGSPQSEIDLFKHAYAEAGWPEVLKARLKRADQGEKNGGTNLTEIASLAAQLGDTDKAFVYLEKKEALSKPEPDLGNLLTEPTFDSVRSDSRFERLLSANLVP